MFGRAHRKYVAQLWAYVAFRWVAVWILIVACVSRGQPGEAAALVIVAADIMASFLGKAMIGVAGDQYTKDWHDRLTNRMFYKLFWGALVANGARGIDIDDLFRQATDDARADLKKASDDDRTMNPTIDTTAWHWFGGVISFCWLVGSSLVYYGSAWTLGKPGW